MKRTMCGAMAVAVTIGMYALGIHQATAGDCWQSEFDGVACNGCQSNLCAPCDLGTCPGTRKVCGTRWKAVSVPEGNYIYNVMEPCFEVYGCKPYDPGAYCGPTNPCTTDLSDVQLSQVWYSDTRFYGDCPGGGGGIE